MNVISKLENLLGLSPESSSAGSFLQLKDGVWFQHDPGREAMQWPASSHWIIGRELLLYHHLDLSEVPRNQRQKVVAQKVGQLSPFEETRHYVKDQDGRIMLWLWDKARQDSAVSETLQEYSALGKHIQKLQTIPEPVLRERKSQGAAVVTCVDGLDEQEWQDSILVSSRWMPSSVESNADFQGLAWGVLDKELSLNREALFWRSGLLLLALLAVYQMGLTAGSLRLNAHLSSKLEVIRAEVADLARIRGEVRRLTTQNIRVLENTGRFDQLVVIAEFDSLIPDSASITEWSFRENSLNVQLMDSELDNRIYLENLARSDLFSDVKIAPGVDAQSAVVSLEVSNR